VARSAPKKQNAVSFDPLMLEMWSRDQFHHFRTCWFQIWCYCYCNIIRKKLSPLFKKFNSRI